MNVVIVWINTNCRSFGYCLTLENISSMVGYRLEGSGLVPPLLRSYLAHSEGGVS